MSKVYGFGDYDNHLSLKLSLGLWLVMLYLLRPFVVMAASLRQKQAGGVRQLIYPDDFSFTLGILATIPTLLLILAWAKRKPAAGDFVRGIWRKGARLLSATAILNIAIVFIPVLMHTIPAIRVAGWVQIAMSVLIIIYVNTSQRVKDTFADFPVESSE